MNCVRHWPTSSARPRVALARERDAAELREVLQSNLEELERLRNIVSDMLFLARAERGERAARRVDTSLARESQDGRVLRHAAPTMRGWKSRWRVMPTWPSKPRCFHRAVTNLLQNAIQHAPRGARILAQVTSTDDDVRVSVSNPSEPIPPNSCPGCSTASTASMPRVPTATPTTGLALAIVKAIASMHGGRVFASSEAGVTTVGFSLGRASA